MKNGLMYNEENLSRVPRELQQSLNEFENAILDIFGEDLYENPSLLTTFNDTV